MSLLRPELLLLALPVLWLLLRSGSARTLAWWLRLAACACLLLALAEPWARSGGRGRDLVAVVDLSRSAGGRAEAEFLALEPLLREAARSGDRLAVLGFGADTVLSAAPSAAPGFAGFAQRPDPDGSHLARALDAALGLLHPERPGSILLLSDGEAHGEAPDAAARRAAARGVRVDVRPTPRPTGPDVAVEELGLPACVGPGEAFAFPAWIRATAAGSAEWRLIRDGEEIARGAVELRSGLNRLLLRDRAQTPGMSTYRLELRRAGDPEPANDVGLGAITIEGRKPLLLINDAGELGRLARALEGAGLPVDPRTPEAVAAWDPWRLSAYAGVVLENVPATRLGALLPHLARQVSDLGGGLLMTGGKGSFGPGGYYRSLLDPLLPVTMEMRVEQRKLGLGLCIVLDRSGSMAAPAGAGRTKMDLANAGAIEAIRLLSALDEVAVIAVDSEPHVVVPLTAADAPESIARRVSGIRSEGGGIYVHAGLVAAGQQLEGSSLTNRHVILFADADDAEEPGRYAELLAEWRARDTTVSVVALGTPAGADAAFLRDVAERGGGAIYFTTSPEELPRLFAQDTLLAARATFVEEPVSTRTASGFLTVAAWAPGPWAALPGHNLTYLRPGAALGAVTEDENSAPILATLQAGLGRTAAFCGQVDGEFGVGAAEWPRVADALATLTQWVADAEAGEDWYSTVRREGREARVSVEWAGAAQAPGAAIELRAVGPDGAAQRLPLAATGSGAWEAMVPIGLEGIHRFAIVTEDGRSIPAESLAVPYSPEFELRADPREGGRLLARLARLSGGRVEPTVNEVWEGPRDGRAARALGPILVWIALALLLAEIAWRRFGALLPRPRPLRLPRRRVASAGAAPLQAGTPTSGGSGGGGAPAAGPAAGSAPPPPGAETPSLDDALAAAKRRARRRL